MLTVVFGWLASGNSSTRRPFPSWYSVIPSTLGPCVMPAGSAAATVTPTKKATGASVRASHVGNPVISKQGRRSDTAAYRKSVIGTLRGYSDGRESGAIDGTRPEPFAITLDGQKLEEMSAGGERQRRPAMVDRRTF